MTNAYQEAMKLAHQAAREATVRLPLNILQDILAELKEAKAELSRIEQAASDRIIGGVEPTTGVTRLNLKPGQ